MRNVLLALLAGCATMSAAAAPPADDPFLWLEQVQSPRALDWVAAENRRSLGLLENDPHYAGLYADALRIAQATDRIPVPEQLGERIVNFWQDAEHVQGIWRVTSPAGYRAATPDWHTLIDLDALSKADGTTWVWHGTVCEPLAERRCLVALSAGGEDASTMREFDLDRGGFVADGFTLPTSKQDVAWESPDSLLVQRDWGPGTTTASGYGFVVKRLKRGQPLAQAQEIFRGAATDQLGTSPTSFVDGQGRQVTLIWRPLTFFESEAYLVTQAGVTKPALPAKLALSGLADGRLVFECNEAWHAGGVDVPAGAIVAVPLDGLAAGRPVPELIFAPGPRQSVDGVSVANDRVVAAIYDNVRGQGWSFAHDGGGWHGTRLPLPDNSSIAIVSTDRTSDTIFLSAQSFTSPPALYAADLRAGGAQAIKTTPPRFDARDLVTEQFEATSSDGTRIPYFVVHRRDIRYDGSTPTLMTAYGGFQISMLPTYQAIRGKLWLERGGAYVLANIRGGGEFGPKWHEAGLKTKRQLIYDDFAAVGEDLIRRKITSPRRLGIYGGSNGGLLMGVELTQRPDLWHAVAIQIPLLDMLRFEHLSAGASWVGEYGSMSVPAERAFWEKTSPYQALRPDGHYPEPFIWTTTKDDRVGPVQARKFAARMKDYHLPYLFWENIEGGHGAGANLRQAARAQALEITYFIRKLMEPQEPPSAPLG